MSGFKHGVSGFKVFDKRGKLAMETTREGDARYRVRRLKGVLTNEKGVVQK